MISTTLVQRIATHPAIVFNVLTTEEGFTSWWGPDDFPVISAAADLQVGGHFRVRFRTADGLEHESTGQFLEISKPERIVTSWRWSLRGEPLEHGVVSRLELQLWGTDAGTELTLIHAGLSNEFSARSHEKWWDGALKKLQRRFEQLPSAVAG